MENQTAIKLELGIDARKIIQQVQIDNAFLENQIQKGIELAMKDISDSDGFVQIIRENTKNEIIATVNKAVMSWDLRSAINKAVQEKIGRKIELYADKIAETITESLK